MRPTTFSSCVLFESVIANLPGSKVTSSSIMHVPISQVGKFSSLYCCSLDDESAGLSSTKSD